MTNIPHALHMPGHIYSQTGKFAEAEKSFGDAAVNELGYIKADALYGSGHHGHNVHYLSTAYAFDGQYDKAKEMRAQPARIQRESSRAGAGGRKFLGASPGLVRADARDGAALRVGMRFWMGRRCRFTIVRASRPGVIGRWAWRRRRRAMPQPRQKRLIRWTRLSNSTRAGEAQAAGRAGGRASGTGRPYSGGRGQSEAGAEQRSDAAATAQRKLRYSEPPYYPRPVDEAIGEIALRLGNVSEAEDGVSQVL